MRIKGKVVAEGLIHSCMSLYNFFYHAFGLKDQECLKTEYEYGNVIIHFQTEADHLCCAWCKSKDDIRKGRSQLHNYFTLCIFY